MLASITFIGYYRNEKKIGVDMGAWMKDQIALLQQLEVQIRKGGGEQRIEKEHKKGMVQSLNLGSTAIRCLSVSCPEESIIHPVISSLCLRVKDLVP